MAMAINPPRSSMIRPVNRNWIPMTLWSVEKMYLRTKPSSWCSCEVCTVPGGSMPSGFAAWAGACACVLMDFLGALRSVGRVQGGALGGEPRVELVPGQDVDLAGHLVVAPPAQLGADEVVGAGLGGLEPDRDVHARHRVLLQAEVRHEEAVQDVATL